MEDSIGSLERVALPQALQQPRSTETPDTSAPIVPDASDACDIAATDNAIYQLANPDCALGYSDGRSEIRRVVNARFRPQSS